MHASFILMILFSVFKYSFAGCWITPESKGHVSAESIVEKLDGSTDIPRYAFNRCKSLKSVQIPSTVITISDLAFYSTNLVSVDFSQATNLLNIKRNAFAYNNKLKRVTIPDSVRDVEYGAFRGHKLSHLVLGRGLRYFGTFAFLPSSRHTINRVIIRTPITSYTWFSDLLFGRKTLFTTISNLCGNDIGLKYVNNGGISPDCNLFCNSEDSQIGFPHYRKLHCTEKKTSCEAHHVFKESTEYGFDNTCTACPDGRVTLSSTSTTCVDVNHTCDAGFFVATEGYEFACQQCPEKHYQSQSNSSSLSCTPWPTNCPQGYFMGIGNTTFDGCQACPQGSFNNFKTNTYVYDGNKYCFDTRTNWLKRFNARQKFDRDSAVNSCSALCDNISSCTGFALWKEEYCILCNGNEFQLLTGTTYKFYDNRQYNRTECPTHRVQSCSPGYFFTPGTALTDGKCTPCPSKTFQPNDNSTNENCTPWKTCDTGYYYRPGNSTFDAQCFPCESGFYQPNSNSVVTTCAEWENYCANTGFELRLSDANATHGPCFECPFGKYNDLRAREEPFFLRREDVTNPPLCQGILSSFKIDGGKSQDWDKALKQGLDLCKKNKLCFGVTIHKLKIQYSIYSSGKLYKFTDYTNHVFLCSSYGISHIRKARNADFGEKAIKILSNENPQWYQWHLVRDSSRHRLYTVNQQIINSCSNWTVCAGGEYLQHHSIHNDGICSPCPDGTYRTEDDPYSQCLPCSNGSFTNNETGKVTCVPWSNIAACPRGRKYVPGTNISDDRCEHCPNGMHQPIDESLVQECLPCNPGTFTNEDVDWDNCRPWTNNVVCTYGHYFVHGTNGSDHQCMKCPDGTYQPNANIESSIESCIPCDNGTYTDATSNKQMCLPMRTECDKGHYFVAGSSASNSLCIPCPHGSFQPDDITAEDNVTSCRPWKTSCNNDDNVLSGGSAVSDRTCIKGYNKIRHVCEDTCDNAVGPTPEGYSEGFNMGVCNDGRTHRLPNIRSDGLYNQCERGTDCYDCGAGEIKEVIPAEDSCRLATLTLTGKIESNDAAYYDSGLLRPVWNGNKDARILISETNANKLLENVHYWTGHVPEKGSPNHEGIHSGLAFNQECRRDENGNSKIYYTKWIDVTCPFGEATVGSKSCCRFGLSLQRDDNNCGHIICPFGMEDGCCLGWVTGEIDYDNCDRFEDREQMCSDFFGHYKCHEDGRVCKGAKWTPPTGYSEKGYRISNINGHRYLALGGQFYDDGKHKSIYEVFNEYLRPSSFVLFSKPKNKMQYQVSGFPRYGGGMGGHEYMYGHGSPLLSFENKTRINTRKYGNFYHWDILNSYDNHVWEEIHGQNSWFERYAGTDIRETEEPDVDLKLQGSEGFMRGPGYVLQHHELFHNAQALNELRSPHVGATSLEKWTSTCAIACANHATCRSIRVGTRPDRFETTYLPDKYPAGKTYCDFCKEKKYTTHIGDMPELYGGSCGEKCFNDVPPYGWSSVVGYEHSKVMQLYKKYGNLKNSSMYHHVFDYFDDGLREFVNKTGKDGSKFDISFYNNMFCSKLYRDPTDPIFRNIPNSPDIKSTEACCAAANCSGYSLWHVDNKEKVSFFPHGVKMFPGSSFSRTDFVEGDRYCYFSDHTVSSDDVSGPKWKNHHSKVYNVMPDLVEGASVHPNVNTLYHKSFKNHHVAENKQFQDILEDTKNILYTCNSTQTCEVPVLGMISSVKGITISTPPGCTHCPAGYAVNSTINGCTVCPAGKFSRVWWNNVDSHKSMGHCETCPQGKVAANKDGENVDEGATHCAECKPGTFTDIINGKTACVDCAPGKFTFRFGSQMCLDCAEGRYASGFASTKCTTCSSGTYQDEEGQVQCKNHKNCEGKFMVREGTKRSDHYCLDFNPSCLDETDCEGDLPYCTTSSLIEDTTLKPIEVALFPDCYETSQRIGADFRIAYDVNKPLGCYVEEEGEDIVAYYNEYAQYVDFKIENSVDTHIRYNYCKNIAPPGFFVDTSISNPNAPKGCIRDVTTGLFYFNSNTGISCDSSDEYDCVHNNIGVEFVTSGAPDLSLDIMACKSYALEMGATFTSGSQYGTTQTTYENHPNGCIKLAGGAWSYNQCQEFIHFVGNVPCYTPPPCSSSIPCVQATEVLEHIAYAGENVATCSMNTRCLIPAVTTLIVDKQHRDDSVTEDECKQLPGFAYELTQQMYDQIDPRVKPPHGCYTYHWNANYNTSIKTFYVNGIPYFEPRTLEYGSLASNNLIFWNGFAGYKCHYHSDNGMPITSDYACLRSKPNQVCSSDWTYIKRWKCASPSSSGSYFVHANCTLTQTIVLNGDLFLRGNNIKMPVFTSTSRMFETSSNNVLKIQSLVIRITSDVEGSFIYSNSANGAVSIIDSLVEGGTIHAIGLQSILINNTVVENIQYTNGAAIYVNGASDVDINFVTFSNVVSTYVIETEGAVSTTLRYTQFINTDAHFHSRGTADTLFHINSNVSNITFQNSLSTVHTNTSLLCRDVPTLDHFLYDGNQTTNGEYGVFCGVGYDKMNCSSKHVIPHPTIEMPLPIECVRLPFCPKGTRKADDGTCLPCTGTTYSDIEDSDACYEWSTCEPGTYMVSNGTNSADRKCEKCGNSTFNANKTNALECDTKTINADNFMSLCNNKGKYTSGSSTEDNACSSCDDEFYTTNAVPANFDNDFTSCHEFTINDGELFKSRGTVSSNHVFEPIELYAIRTIDHGWTTDVNEIKSFCQQFSHCSGQGQDNERFKNSAKKCDEGLICFDDGDTLDCPVGFVRVEEGKCSSSKDAFSTSFQKFKIHCNQFKKIPVSSELY